MFCRRKRVCYVALATVTLLLLYAYCVLNIWGGIPVYPGLITRLIYDPGHDASSSGLCPDHGRRLKLLISVISAPVNKNARMAIRNSWGNNSLYNDTLVLFFIGRSLDEEQNELIRMESEEHEDIILEWVSERCENVPFVLKVDDDVFVNVDNLLRFVETKSHHKNAMFGEMECYARPVRWFPIKWYVSYEEYRPSWYPEYLQGNAYLLTASSIPLLYKAALNSIYLKLEDVFLTGIIADSLLIDKIHSSLFVRRYNSPLIAKQKNSDLIRVAKTKISIHEIGHDEQIELWNSIKN